jgi:hypothetical protein
MLVHPPPFLWRLVRLKKEGKQIILNRKTKNHSVVESGTASTCHAVRAVENALCDGWSANAKAFEAFYLACAPSIFEMKALSTF